MSQAGLLTKIVNRISSEITSRGLTAYMLIDPWGGGGRANKILQVNVTAQQVLADRLRGKGVDVVDITDLQNGSYTDRGVIVTWMGDWLLGHRGVLNKLKKAGNIRWLISFFHDIEEDAIEDFERVINTVVTHGEDEMIVQVFKRIKVNI